VKKLWRLGVVLLVIFAVAPIAQARRGTTASTASSVTKGKAYQPFLSKNPSNTQSSNQRKAKNSKGIQATFSAAVKNKQAKAAWQAYRNAGKPENSPVSTGSVNTATSTSPVLLEKPSEISSNRLLQFKKKLDSLKQLNSRRSGSVTSPTSASYKKNSQPIDWNPSVTQAKSKFVPVVNNESTALVPPHRAKSQQVSSSSSKGWLVILGLFLVAGVLMIAVMVLKRKNTPVTFYRL
jgi:hypothetical protein